MKAAKTTGELMSSLSFIMAGAINGDVKEKEGRLALNAATRMTELMQAESRIRVIQHKIGEKVSQIGSIKLQGGVEGT